MWHVIYAASNYAISPASRSNFLLIFLSVHFYTIIPANLSHSFCVLLHGVYILT